MRKLERISHRSVISEDSYDANVSTVLSKDLLQLTSQPFARPNVEFSTDVKFRYAAQLFFNGQSAAILIENGVLQPILAGARSTDPAFTQIVEDYRDGILKTVKRLKLADSDRAILTGVWNDVDRNEEPRFEPSIIHILSGDGRLKTRLYDLAIFDWDRPGEGRHGVHTFKVSSSDELLAQMQVATEVLVQKDAMADVVGEENAVAGVVWFPLHNDDPVIVQKAVGFREMKMKERLERPEQLSRDEREALNAQARFLELLAQQPSSAALEQVSEAYRQLMHSTEMLVDETADYIADTVLDALSDTVFGVLGAQIVLRDYRTELPTLTDVVNSTPVVGGWTEYREADTSLRFCNFTRFSTAWRTGKKRLSGATMHRVTEQMEGILSAQYASDWVPVQAEGKREFRMIVVSELPPFGTNNWH